MKRLICFLLTLLLLPGCSRQEEVVATVTPTITVPQETEQTRPSEPTIPPVEDDGEFSFRDLQYVEFRFNSGAGGWGTVLTVAPDGSFTGSYQDSNMGIREADYPNGSVDLSNFTGKFSQPEQIDAHTYSLKIEALEYDVAPGIIEVREGIRYNYITAYGLAGTEEVLLYLPGSPLENLPEEYVYWSNATLYGYEGTTLPHYGLYNPEDELGFYSFDILADIRSRVREAEDACAELDVWLETHYTQADMNAASQDKYLLWDSVLNNLWAVLKQVLPEGTMAQLTSEELAWIREKEAAVEAAGAEVEGGSVYPTVVNGTAAQMTRERVYELLEYLPDQQ